MLTGMSKLLVFSTEQMTDGIPFRVVVPVSVSPLAFFHSRSLNRSDVTIGRRFQASHVRCKSANSFQLPVYITKSLSNPKALPSFTFGHFLYPLSEMPLSF
jgi:hypothetical protein